MNAPLTLEIAISAAERDGRIAAQVSAGGVWVQGTLLARGLARVRTAPHDTMRAAAMLAAETRSRRSRSGMWGTRVYAVRDAVDIAALRGDAGSFQVVVGTVRHASRRSDGVYLDFGEDWRTDTTARLDRDAVRRFIAGGVMPLTLAGRRVRLRGWVENRRGPQIAITHPEQIEVLSPDIP